MAGIDLATAQQNLTIWLNGQEAVAAGRTFTVNNREYSQHDLDAIRRMIEYWDQKCKELDRGSSAGAHRMVVND